MTVGELEKSISNFVDGLLIYLSRLIHTFTGDIPRDDVLVADVIVLFILGFFIAGSILIKLGELKEYIEEQIFKFRLNKHKLKEKKTYKKLMMNSIFFTFGALGLIMFLATYFTFMASLIFFIVLMDAINTGEATTNGVIKLSLSIFLLLSYSVLGFIKRNYLMNLIAGKIPLKISKYLFQNKKRN